MTISYSESVGRLLLRWKGSLWQVVWSQLLIYLLLYYSIRFLYRYGLDHQQQSYFEELVMVMNAYLEKFPLSFLIGFYVFSIVSRWWQQVMTIAWPDNLVTLICAIFHESSEEDRLKRHTVARYLNLTQTLVWRDISTRVRKRFPTIDYLVSAGLMTEEELALYESVECACVKWFIPLHWAQTIVNRHLIQQRRPMPQSAPFFKAMKNYRSSFRLLYIYDWICIPLVYSQAAALAMYGYFGLSLVGRQFLIPTKSHPLNLVDFYVPVFTLLQFLFYAGWFQVAQVIMWPFGTDDDDIELNYLLDRHIAASYAIVESNTSHKTDLTFFADPAVHPIPHTNMSAKIKDHPPKLHAMISMKCPEDGAIEEALNGKRSRETSTNAANGTLNNSFELQNMYRGESSCF